MKILLETWDDIFSDEVEETLFYPSGVHTLYMIYETHTKKVYKSLYGAYIETIETVEEFKQKYPNGKVFRLGNFDLTDW